MASRRDFLKTAALTAASGGRIDSLASTAKSRQTQSRPAAAPQPTGAGRRPNILLLISDQQRADCLSILGHPMIRTPNHDRLAKMGVLFSNAYVQSNPCGPSRVCIYTGRYAHCHRSLQNEVPVPDDERMMGWYFQQAGYRTAHLGKTGYVKDFYLHPPAPGTDFLGGRAAQTWYGPPPDYEDLGFGMGPGFPGYGEYLREKGYAVGRDKAILRVVAPDGEILESEDWRATKYPLNIRAEDAFHHFETDKAMEFISEATGGDQPWLLTVEMIHPHNPWVVCEPYHSMYDPAKVPMPNRTLEELNNAPEIQKKYRIEREGVAFDNEDYCRRARATYYGMITELDDNLGRLLDFMEKSGHLKDTIIIWTSDHGEYMGDHWMAWKEGWHEPSYRVPLIIYDPSAAAAGARGKLQDAFVEEIDILPTLLELAGQEISWAIQGRSLVPLLHEGKPPADWRQEVHAEWDFRFFWTAHELELRPDQCQMMLLRDRHFNYVHFDGLPPILYDLEKDPNELRNVAGEAKYKEVIDQYRLRMLNWRMRTVDNSRIGFTYSVRPHFGPNPFRMTNPWPRGEDSDFFYRP